MKKIILTLMLIMSISFAFANNNTTFQQEITSLDGSICKYSITKTTYYPNGQILSETKTYTSITKDRQSCQSQIRSRLAGLRDGVIPF